MTTLLALCLMASMGTPLRLDLRAPQKDLLVGEPVKLVLTWQASQKLEAHIDDESNGLVHLQIWVDGGSGPRRYWEAMRSAPEQLVAPTEFVAGEEVVQNISLLRGGYGDREPEKDVGGFMFPVTGHYKVRVAYSDAKGLRAESNDVSFDVKEPTGEDREVLERLRRQPELLTTEKGAGLLKQHPRSPYLRWARLLAIQEREIELRNRRDPDSGASLWHLDKDSLEAFQAERFRRMTQDLLGDDDWGAFEEERLDLATRFAEMGKDESSAERARKELVQKFPRSAAVKRLQAQEAASAAKDKEKEKDEGPPKKPSKGRQ
jgi:hypothetical protein